MLTDDLRLKLSLGYKSNWLTIFFLLCELISTEKASVKSFSIDKSFDGISRLIYKRIPPSLLLRSRRWGLLKTFMKNWLVGKLSSSFVSEIIRISALSLIWCVSNSNLFLRDLIFKCPFISLFRFLTLRDLNSAFILILPTWFFASGIYSSFHKGVE